MRTAETILNVIRERGMPRRQSPFTLRLLESHVIRKSVMRGLEGGDWKSACKGNSPVAYPTSRPVLQPSRGSDSLA